MALRWGWAERAGGAGRACVFAFPVVAAYAPGPWWSCAGQGLWAGGEGRGGAAQIRGSCRGALRLSGGRKRGTARHPEPRPPAGRGTARPAADPGGRPPCGDRPRAPRRSGVAAPSAGRGHAAPSAFGRRGVHAGGMRVGGPWRGGGRAPRRRLACCDGTGERRARSGQTGGRSGAGRAEPRPVRSGQSTGTGWIRGTSTVGTRGIRVRCRGRRGPRRRRCGRCAVRRFPGR